MSTYRTTRGKLVALGSISLAVNDDGSLMIRVGEKRIDLTEAEASELHDLFSDVLAWESNRGTTEAKFDKMADQDEASGEMDDERAHVRRGTEGITFAPPPSGG